MVLATARTYGLCVVVAVGSCSELPTVATTLDDESSRQACLSFAVTAEITVRRG